MRINEVQQSASIKRAIDLVEQIYKKENRPLFWDQDEKPTIAEMIDRLDNSFLSNLVAKKDLDLFLEEADKWLNRQ